jgi:hypothetical protein
MNLGDCTLCGHPRRMHEDFERCLIAGCDCVRPAIIVITREELECMREDAVRALHECAEAIAGALMVRKAAR